MNFLKDNINILSFINTVKKCEKDVHLKTIEGDCLNLKSSLCQYIFAFASSTESSKEFLKQAVIECDLETDYLILSDYITDKPATHD